MAYRVLKAFAICPLIPAVAIAIANGVMGGKLAMIPVGVLVYLPFSYLLVLLFGSVTLLALRALNLRSCRAHGIAGALTGCVVAIILTILMLGRLSAFEPGIGLINVLLFAVIGSLTGVVFWRVAILVP